MSSLLRDAVWLECVWEANVTHTKRKEYILQLKRQLRRESICSGFWIMSRQAKGCKHCLFSALGSVMEHVRGELVGFFVPFSVSCKAHPWVVGRFESPYCV